MAEVKHSCGIAAVYLRETIPDADKKAIFYLYRMLLNLQNRGQLSAGVTTYSRKRSQLIDTYKNLGHVNEVFKTNDVHKSVNLFKKYAGNKGIGHVRYATSGVEDKTYAQPFERHHGRMWKWFSFCFNGNLVNYAKLKKTLMEKIHYHIIHDTDTEIMMHYIARELRGGTKPDIADVFARLANKFDGSYNVAFMNAFGDLAVLRDPMGFRPLCYSIEDDKLLAASESNAIQNCGFSDIKSLEPGKMIAVQDGNIEIRRCTKCKRKAYCMFEWVYFANVGSVLDDRSVYVTRTNLGKELAKLETEKITKDHVIVPVPDTAKAAGDAMAYELGVPSQEGLVRNRYIGRTFIEGVEKRGRRVENKYTAIKQILRDKKVILVDDSIVRGATCKEIVRYLKEVGRAKEVHLRVSCPPIKAPCFYGIDMSTIAELLLPNYEKPIDPKKTSQELLDKIAKDVGADSLIYNTIPGLVRSLDIPEKDLCNACLTGKYPTPEGRRLYAKAVSDFKKGRKEGKRSYEC
ncbi:amidophosphoribosyltransferase [Candidatus Woesearchaeota archaeon]|nr:amidophosphoribosyltransferase [Candidatus Woesearchaeota archaeon]